MRQYLKSILTNYNYLEAKDCQDALKIINEQHIDCIICDYMMPIMNGPNFVRNLKEQNNPTPIIMLTAKRDRESKLSLLKLGIEEYITKPFDTDELLIRVSNIINKGISKSVYVEKTVLILKNKTKLTLR